MRALYTPAAQQMLLYSQGSSPHPNFNAFYQALGNLGNGGYPAQSRNVALINGSLNGNRQLVYLENNLLNPGDKILDFQLRVILTMMSVKAWTNNLGGSTKVYEGGSIGIFNGFSASTLNVNLPINRDRLPGGYISYGTERDNWFLKMPVRTRFTFIPTYSAIDYKGPLNNDGNFTFPISGNIVNAQFQVTNPALTPFSAIYGPDFDNEYHAFPRDIQATWNDLAFRELGLKAGSALAQCLNFSAPPAVTAASKPGRGGWSYRTLPAEVCKYQARRKLSNNVITLYLSGSSQYYEQFIKITGPNSYFKQLQLNTGRVNRDYNDAQNGTYNIRSVRQLPGGTGRLVTSRTLQINTNCRVDMEACPSDGDNGELIGILADTNEPCYSVKVNGIWIAVLEDGTFVSRERLIINGLTTEGANCYAAIDPTGSNPASTCSNRGSITYQRWEGIGGGTSIENLLNDTNYFQNNPTVTQNVTLFEGPTDIAENYGARIIGYVCPPTTGLYTFWIAGDDNVELWPSTDDTEDNSELIAYHDNWTSSREWNKFNTQQSYPVTLQAGQRYYIEARVKEGNGGDNLAVGWQLPNGALERPIPGSRLIPFTVVSGCDFNVSINPSSLSVAPNGSVTLNATCTGSNCSGVNYSWSGNGVSGSGSAKTFNAPGSNGSYTYTVTASKNGCSSKTATATVNVQTGGNVTAALSIWRAGPSGTRYKIQDLTNNVQIAQSSLGGNPSNWFITIDGQVTNSSGSKYYDKVELYMDGPGISNYGWGPENVAGSDGGPFGLYGRDGGITAPLGSYQLRAKVYNGSTVLVNTTLNFSIVSCTPPSAPSISKTSGTTVCGATSQSVTLTATGCSGTVTWYRNGNQVGTGTTHQTTTAGSYTATCTVSGCASPASGAIVVQETSGCGAGQGTGTGLTATYYNNMDLSGTPALTRVDPTINFDWGAGSPGSGVNIDMFSVRWEGQVEAPATGTYIFKTNDDGSKLWVNVQLLIDDWVPHGPTPMQGSISLTGGQKYNIKKEYFESIGGAESRLYWEYPGQGHQVVPQTRLYPTGCTPPSAPSISKTSGTTVCGATSQSVTLTATGCSGTVTWYRNGNQVGTGTTHQTTTAGSYTATCTVSGCASPASGAIVVQETSGCGSSGDCYTITFKGENPKVIFNHNGIVKVKTADNSNSQIFKMQDAGGGYFKLVSQGSTNGTKIGYVLGVRNQGGSENDLIDLQTSASGDHQLWSRTELTGEDVGRYKIERKGTGYRIGSYRNWGHGELSAGESDLALVSDPTDLFGWNKWTFTAKTCPSQGARISFPESFQAFSDENELPNLQVWPVPSDGNLEASFHLVDDKPVQLSIVDMQGRSWYERTFVGKGMHKDSIRLSPEASGVFVVLLRTGSGEQTRKIVVVR